MGDRRRDIGRPNEGDSFADIYKQIPILTKVLTTSTVAITLCLSFGLVTPGLLFFDWNNLIQNFHIWRLFTPFVFIGKIIYDRID